MRRWFKWLLLVVVLAGVGLAVLYAFPQGPAEAEFDGHLVVGRLLELWRQILHYALQRDC